MSSEIAIKAENLSKCYHIYDSPHDRLKQFVLPRLQRLVGLKPRPYFEEFWALRDVSLEIKKGETVGIIGCNGSGKSTLLQMICGTLNPTDGTVRTTGRVAALLELGSGFNPEFTGSENVHMNAAILGLSPEEIEDRFDDIAAFADIGDFLRQPVKSYSTGMVVRLAFAVQAMIDPDILVVDEALAVGDERFQRKCYARLEQLKGKGTAILFVSHSAPTVVELCDRALLLDSGVQLLQGKPQEVIRAYQHLLYAPPEQRKEIVEEYRVVDRADEIARGAAGNNSGATKPAVASFDPGLVPETTTVYPMQGAEIGSITVLDRDSRIVNVLEPDEIYYVEMSGRFLKDFTGIYFGVHIRNVSGAVITGQRHPEEGSYVHYVRAGACFKIRFSFRMSMLPGAYFVGGGVWSIEGPSCAHRILDAVMLRVSPLEKQTSFGYVSLAGGDTHLEVI